MTMKVTAVEPSTCIDIALTEVMSLHLIHWHSHIPYAIDACRIDELYI